jgi:Na+/H+ antiporter NhaA
VSSEQTLQAPVRPGPALRISVPMPYRSASLGRFLANEAVSAGLLLVAAIAALIWANIGHGYETFWSTEVALNVGDWTMSLDLRHVINDAAMAIFFLVVGLEISREVTVGELRNRRTVIVPALGAVGGLVLPALIYVAFVHEGPAAAGWGIPMSTDTAFLIGILALFGPRCPDQLRLFLLTLAIVDDIGAITVMAIFYTPSVSVPALVVTGVLVVVLLAMRWLGVWRLAPYLLVGLLLWGAVFASGVHPTLAGVLLGLIVPAAPVEDAQFDRLRYFGLALIDRADPVRARLATAAAPAAVPAHVRLQNELHPVSAFVVVPLFGLANAGVALGGDALGSALHSNVAIGIVVALLVGNAVGISVTAGIALRSGWGALPGRVRYGHLIGGAVLAGIGFTISLFITDLAFTDELLRRDAKIGVLVGSLLAAVLGSVLLRYLGERLPLCTIDDDEELPELPEGPWEDPSLA